MRSGNKPEDGHSPLEILTELAVEGTSSLVETQRAILNLAQRENEILLNGFKERIEGFIPGVAMTDLVRRTLDTLIGVQQELLTTTSKQTLQLLETEKIGKSDRAAYLVDFAREGVEAFTRAQKKFLDAVAQETAKATSGRPENERHSAKKRDIKELAREAGTAFLEAQKRLLDVMGQQMNVNLDSTARTLELISPSRLLPIATLTGEGVRKFVDAETSLIGALVTPRKKAGRVQVGKVRTARKAKSVRA